MRSLSLLISVIQQALSLLFLQIMRLVIFLHEISSLGSLIGFISERLPCSKLYPEHKYA